MKFYMLNEVSEMVGHHGQVTEKRDPCFFSNPNSPTRNTAPTRLALAPQLKEVVLNSGKVLRADVCVIGAGDPRIAQNSQLGPVGVIPCLSPTGSVPATGFLKQSGINMDSKGFITVNKVCLKRPKTS